LIPHTLAVFAIAAADRVFITEMIGVAETGVYMVGLQIAMGLALVLIAFNRAWAPWLFRQLENSSSEHRRRLVGLTYGYFGVVVLAALALGLLAPVILRVLVGEEFIGADRFVL